MKKGYIYVLKCNDAVKVGYTTDLDKRIKAHRVSNPFIEFICSYEGSIEDEKLIHKKLSKHLKENCTEWFNYYEKILDDIESCLEFILNKKQTQSENPFINNNKIDVTFNKFGNLIEKQNKINLYYNNNSDMDNILFQKLSSRARDLFLYIVYHLPNNQDYLEIKIKKIVETTKMSRNSVVNALKCLKSENLVSLKKQSVYWVNPMFFFKGNRVSFYKSYGENHLNIVNDN